MDRSDMLWCVVLWRGVLCCVVLCRVMVSHCVIILNALCIKIHLKIPCRNTIQYNTHHIIRNHGNLRAGLGGMD